MSVEIAQLRREQLSELRDFLREAYPDDPRKHDLNFLSWYFLENPNQSADEVPLWVAIDDGKIVGQLATILVDLMVGAELTKAIWILEFILLPKYRGQGLGKRLVRAAEARYPTMITLGINDASTRVFVSLGWKAMGSIHRYHRMLYAGNATKELAKNWLLRGIANLASAPLRSGAGKGAMEAGYELRRGGGPGPDWDRLWERASKQWTCAVRRSKEFLKWQFEEQPGKKFDFIQLYRGEELVGYAVLFFRAGTDGGPPPKAAISDLVYDPDRAEEIIDALIRAALGEAIARKAGSLVTDVLDAKVEARLKKHRFWQVRNAPRFMASSKQFQGAMYREENWHLTRGDADVSIFEEPNEGAPLR